LATFQMRAGDNSIVIETQLKRRDGTLQPLSGSETLQFIFSDWYATDQITKTGSITDITNSKVAVTLLGADTSAQKGKVLKGRVPLTFAGGAIETYPTAPDDLLLELL
jgi:hypothetical protein